MRLRRRAACTAQLRDLVEGYAKQAGDDFGQRLPMSVSGFAGIGSQRPYGAAERVAIGIETCSSAGGSTQHPRCPARRQ